MALSVALTCSARVDLSDWDFCLMWLAPLTRIIQARSTPARRWDPALALATKGKFLRRVIEEDAVRILHRNRFD